MFKRIKPNNFLILVVLVAVLTMTIGCARQPATKQEKPKELELLRIAVMPYIHSLPASLVTDRGWDTERGFKGRLLLFVSGPPMNEALAAGEWDVGNMGIACLTAAARYDAKIIGVICDSAWGQDVWVRPDSPIAKVKGHNPQYPNVYGNPATVRGKTILVPVATVGHYDVLQWLKIIGVKEEEVKIVHMEVPLIVSAFGAGQGDVAFLWSPQTYVAADKGWVKAAGANDIGVVAPDVIVASRKAFEEHPELLARHLVQFYRAIDELKRDPEKTFPLLKAWFEKHGSKIDDKWIKAELENRPYFTLEDNLKAFQKGPDGLSDIERWLGAQAEFFVERGKLQAEDKKAALKAITDEILRMAADLQQGK